MRGITRCLIYLIISKNLIYEEMYSIDDVGMSDSTVIVFNDKILKIKQSVKKHLGMNFVLWNSYRANLVERFWDMKEMTTRPIS